MNVALIVPGGEKEMAGMQTVARPPLGVCYLKSYLEQNGHKARVFHQINETDSELIDKILEFSPKIAGFSTMSCNFHAGADLAKAIKVKKPEVKTVFGGEHVTGIYVDEIQYGSKLMTTEFLQNPAIDFMIPFEGELALTELVKGVKHNKDPSKIPGIAFRSGNHVISTGRIPRIQNLDDLPMADRSDLPYEKYHSPDDSQDLEYLHTARGCRFRCIYCATPVSNPGKVVANSAERVVEEIEDLYKRYGRTSFFFVDELFTYDPERVRKICQSLIDKGLSEKIKWRCFARVDDVARKKINLDLMKRAGLKGIFYGVESMNPDTLRRLGKGTNPEQAREAARIAHEKGIDVWGSLMMGYPWEDKKALRQSLDDYLQMVKAGTIKHTYIAFITPFPGTKFYRQCIDNNWITDPTYLTSDCSRPVLKTPIPEKTLINIYKGFLKQVVK